MKKIPLIKTFVFSPFQENTYVLYEEGGEGVVIDPGNSTREEDEEIFAFIRKNRLHLRHVLLTHGHLDHICGVPLFHEAFGLRPEIHPDDLYLYQTVNLQGEMFSFQVGEMPEAEQLTSEPVTFGEVTLEVIPLPGHTPGGVAFFSRVHGLLFSGDILFRGSIGRTDLPGGNYDMLKNSIRSDILGKMDENVRVFPGHGPETTVGYEARTNPFLDFV